MMDVLVRIKRAVLAGRYAFSKKARIEMELDGITELDVAESILNAVAIYKTIRSQSPFRRERISAYHSKYKPRRVANLIKRKTGKRGWRRHLLFPCFIEESFVR